jgi:hypothetical protein
MKNTQRVSNHEINIENFFKKYSNTMKLDENDDVRMDFSELNQSEIKEVMIFCYTFKEFPYFEECLKKYCKKHIEKIKLKDKILSIFNKWVNTFR